MSILNVLPQLFQGALMTIKISFLSVIFGTLGGVIMGIFTSKQMKVPFLNFCIKSYVSVIRGTPIFIQLLIIYFALPQVTGFDITPFTAGVLALSFNSCAYVAEIIRGGINTIAKGQWEASFSLGYSNIQTLSYIILPQTFKNVFPSITNEFIALVKESSILMILGVQELTKVSKDIVSRELNPFQIYIVTALIYFCITSLVSWISSKCEGVHHE